MKFIIGLICLCTGLSLQAQFETGVDYRTLDSLIFNASVSEKAPGMAAIIIKDDSIVYFGTKGYANVKDKLPIGLHTQYNIGSVTKMFTATAIVLLEQEGKLNRNDEVKKYIPELPDAANGITIHQLIAHTSGIRDHFKVSALLFNYTAKLQTYDGMFEYYATYHQPNNKAGDYFAYSNTGYMLLAKIIETASGMSYANYLEQAIFIPLGMSSTYVSEGKVTYLEDGTTSYRIKNSGKAKHPDSYTDALGATGINSTLYDLYLWDKNFYNNKLGDTNYALIDTIEKNYLLNNGNNTYYGHGIINKNYRGKTAREHSGGWSNYLTQYRRFPDEHISIIAWNNSTNYSPFTTVDKLCDAVFNFDSTRTTTDMRPGFKQKELEGTYITENNYIREVRLKGDTLILRLPLNQSTRFHRLTYTGSFRDSLITYTDTAGNAVVFRKNNDTINGFTWKGGEYFVGERYYSKINENNIIPVKRITGKYFLEEENKHIKIIYKKRKHKLYFRNFPVVRYELNHVCGNVYFIKAYDMYLRVEGNSVIVGDDWIFNVVYTKK